jgi:transposase-like protein
VKKGQWRRGQIGDTILSLYARGITPRDIRAHLAEVYGAPVSPALVSMVTDVGQDEIVAWPTRPLESNSLDTLGAGCRLAPVRGLAWC